MQKSVQLFFFLFLYTTSLIAQDSYRAVHWTLNDGLSQSEVAFMLKDAHNFLWVGTRNGLNRFDGSIFKKYYHNPQKSGTILGSEIGGIVEDSLHNVWVGTNKGISRYDIKAETFTNFLPAVNNTFDSNITPFWTTPNEVYCVERGAWITAYHVQSLKKRMVMKLTPTDSVGMGPAFSYSYLDVKTNTVWMLRGGPFMMGGGLLAISLSTGKRTEYGWPCYKNIKDHNHTSEAMRYDPKRHCLWINSPDGLVKFTLTGKQFHHIEAVDNLVSLTDPEKNPDRWVGIDLDRKGNVWVATLTKGIVIYNPDTNLAGIPFPENQDMQKEVSDFNAVIYCDRDGIVWSGFWLRKGIYQLLPYSKAVRRFSKEINDVPVTNVKNGADHKLWIGTPDGLRIFDPNTGVFQALRKKELPGLQGDVVIPIRVDIKSNKAWLVSDKVYEMNLTTKQCKPVVFKAQSTGNTISPFQVRPSSFGTGCLSIAFYDDKQGVFFIDSKSDVAQEVLTFPAGNINQYFMAPVNDHLLFLKRPDALGNLSYAVINGKWTKISTPLDRISWTVVHYNKADSTYWVVAEKQLIHYNKAFKQLRVYTPKDGLPEYDVYGIIADKNGNIWFNTDRSIHQLNIQTGTFSTLTEKDGFESQNFINGPNPFSDIDGTLYFPSGWFGAGFDQINPNKYTTTPSSVYVYALNINELPIDAPTGANSLQALSLRYFENIISVETGTIDYYSKGKNTLRYKLEGLDTTWRYAPNNYIIRYDGLAPNTYTLLLQASNASNEFNGEPKKLMIHITPPWWKTWWAYLGYVLLTLGSIWAFIQYRSRTLLRQNQLLENKVTERTAEVVAQKEELHKTLSELKTTQNQLIQKEKLASLGELTAGIAHEIQNPLNFVNNFSELSVDLVKDLKDEIEKPTQDKEYISELFDDLSQNQEKINHHGKRASSIVSGMLEHSRTSTGERVMTDINKLADEYLRLSYHGLRAKNGSFSADYELIVDENLPLINVVPQDIGRVLLNLINNAFYAVHQRNLQGLQDLTGFTPKIYVSTKKLNNEIQIKVTDNGSGIPENIKEKIFQPFFTTKPTGEGTGLGLSLSYDIVTKGHGGTIEVESKEGEGSEFVVTLPIQINQT